MERYARGNGSFLALSVTKSLATALASVVVVSSLGYYYKYYKATRQEQETATRPWKRVPGALPFWATCYKFPPPRPYCKYWKNVVVSIRAMRGVLKCN